MVEDLIRTGLMPNLVQLQATLSKLLTTVCSGQFSLISSVETSISQWVVMLCG